MVNRSVILVIVASIILALVTSSSAIWLPRPSYGQSADKDQNAILNGGEEYRISASTSLCGTDDDIFIVESITLTPDPPQKGQTLVIEARGTLKEDGTLMDFFGRLMWHEHNI